MRAMLDAHALEIKGDPDAEGSAASEVSVQLHGMPVRATSRNDVDSTHKAYAVNFIGAWRGVEAAISAARTQANHQAPPPLRSSSHRPGRSQFVDADPKSPKKASAKSLDLAIYEHWHGTERHHFCRLAAEQQARDPPSPMRSHYNEVAGIGFCRLDDRLCRKIGDVQCFALNAHCVCFPTNLIQNFCGCRFGRLFVSGGEIGGDGF